MGLESIGLARLAMLKHPDPNNNDDFKYPYNKENQYVITRMTKN